MILYPGSNMIINGIDLNKNNNINKPKHGEYLNCIYLCLGFIIIKCNY